MSHYGSSYGGDRYNDRSSFRAGGGGGYGGGGGGSYGGGGGGGGSMYLSKIASPS